MTTSIALLVPLLVLLVVGLFAFAGCTAFGAAPSETTPLPPARTRPPGSTTPGMLPPGTTTPPGTTPPGQTYSEVIAGEMGLRGYWRLGETAPGPAADSKPGIGNNRPGTYNQPVTLGEPGVLRLGKDPTDTAARFDGQGFVDIDTHDDVVNPLMSWSIEAWMQPALPAAGVGAVVASYATSPDHAGFVLEVIRDAGGTLTAQIRVGGGGAGFSSLQADLGPGTALGGWRHVVATYNAPTKELKLYVSLSGTPTVATAPTPVGYKVVDFANSPFRIGVGRVETAVLGTPPPANFFIGHIDEVALYDRVLDVTTVAAHFIKATTP